MALTPSFVSPPKGELVHLLRLGRYLVPYRLRVAGGLVALVVAAGCVLLLGQGVKHVVDGGFGSGDPHLLNVALAGVVTVSTVLACATFARFYLMMSVGERIIADLREAVFSHVLTLTPAFFDSARTGEQHGHRDDRRERRVEKPRVAAAETGIHDMAQPLPQHQHAA